MYRWQTRFGRKHWMMYAASRTFWEKTAFCAGSSTPETFQI